MSQGEKRKEGIENLGLIGKIQGKGSRGQKSLAGGWSECAESKKGMGKVEINDQQCPCRIWHLV